MRRKNLTPRIRLYLVGAFILLAGLAGATLVYLNAADDDGDSVGYELAGGNVQVITPGGSKSYRHDLELYGGKAAVLADDFNRWFADLWQGRRLAYTLALLASGVALVCFLAARHLSGPPENGDIEDRDD